MKQILFFILMGTCLAAYPQCTPTLTGDTTACAGTHRYQTDSLKTNYHWECEGCSFVTGSCFYGWADLTWVLPSGYVRVTYDECQNPGVIIVGECTTTGIQEHIKPTVDGKAWDLLGRPTAEHGLYIKNGTKYFRP